jgi:hypothetical protein
MVTPLTIEPIIYRHELETYKKNSRRALNESKRRRGKWINTFRNTVSQYTPLLALIGTTLLVSHSIYG